MSHYQGLEILLFLNKSSLLLFYTRPYRSQGRLRKKDEMERKKNIKIILLGEYYSILSKVEWGETEEYRIFDAI